MTPAYFAGFEPGALGQPFDTAYCAAYDEWAAAGVPASVRELSAEFFAGYSDGHRLADALTHEAGAV